MVTWNNKSATVMLEQKTEPYIDLQLTNFPVSEDYVIRKSDVDVVIMPVVQQYNKYFATGNLAACNALKESNPNILKYIFTADDFNWAMDAIIAIQRYYLEDVQEFINAVAQNTVGIENNPTEEQMDLVTYSAKRIQEMVGFLLDSDVSVLMDDWTEVTREDGFKYKWTYENEIIADTDEILVYFNNASMISASKAMIVVDEDGTAGSFNLIAVKKPKTNLTIREIKVVR